MTLHNTSRRFRIRTTTALAIVPLIGCVGLPRDDLLLLSEGSKVIGTDGVECGNGWQELFASSERDDLLDSRVISLISWNVYKAREGRWPEDFKTLIVGRDLVLLQEAHLMPSFRAALKASGLQWLMVRAYDYHGAETGVLTAGTASASSACIKRTAEPLIRVPKSILLTRYRLSGYTDELWVVNLHGVNFSLGTERFQRQLEALAEVLAPYPGPLLVAGDFNDWNRARDDIVHRFALKLELTALDFAEDRRSRHLGGTVDHVFYRGLDLIDAKAIAVQSSDHHPILASFRLSDDAQKGQRR